jgi:ectoine hydroxylase-related dioxygenase (phytanoyl-CoA dioxygenase family)
MHSSSFSDNLSASGFTIVPDVYSKQDISELLNLIKSADTSKSTFRKTADLFAVRQFIKEIPQVRALLFNENLKAILKTLFGEHYFLVKSIYFDKPAQSNWFVAYHQDLTISVDQKIELTNFGPWTVKQNQFGVQPPLEVLKSIITIRIHLDNTDENNGALKVIPGSHLKSIYRPETIDWNSETEVSCSVPEGGIMIMKPLLLHSSNRTTNNQKRRVIHLEFSNLELPNELKWAERENFTE